MKFHSGPRFGLSEEDQAAIYWLCTSYERLSPETRQVIDDAIRSVGGIYAVPLREAVTNWPIDPSHLARRVGAVYKILAKTLPVWKSASGDPPAV